MNRIYLLNMLAMTMTIQYFSQYVCSKVDTFESWYLFL